MKKQFIPYELALKLKELGFDEECLGYYTPPEKGNLYRLDDKKTNLCVLSTKMSGELHGHGTVRNFLFKWLKDNNRTSGELYLLSIAVTAPLWQQAFDWFREKHNLFVKIDFFQSDEFKGFDYDYSIIDLNKPFKEDGITDNPLVDYSLNETYYFKYEEARQACLEKLIELCQKN